MKASNLTLAIAALFFSPISSTIAQQDVEILAKIDETDDYKERKTQNDHLFPELWRADLQPDSPDFNSPIEVMYTLSMPSDDLGEWVNLNLTDDGSALITLPFAFEFFGDTHRETWVNANGNISFNESVGSFKAEKFPIVVPMIAPFWTDLVPIEDSRSGVFVHTEPGSMRVLWNKMKINVAGVEDTVSFELLLQANDSESSDTVVFDVYGLPQEGGHQGDGNMHILINYSGMLMDSEHQGDGNMHVTTNYSGMQTDGEHQGDGNMHVTTNYSGMLLDGEHQGDGNMHIIMNYYEVPTGFTRNTTGLPSPFYVAGINSGKKDYGYHIFDLSKNVIVANVTR